MYCQVLKFFNESWHPLKNLPLVVQRSLQNCHMKVKSLFEDVDQLLAKIKAETNKNKTRQKTYFWLPVLLQDGKSCYKMVKRCLEFHQNNFT